MVYNVKVKQAVRNRTVAGNLRVFVTLLYVGIIRIIRIIRNTRIEKAIMKSNNSNTNYLKKIKPINLD
jgi:hypothetical protein